MTEQLDQVSYDDEVSTRPGDISTRHLFRRLARSRERALRRAFPDRAYKVERMSPGQSVLHGKRWAIVRTR